MGKIKALIDTNVLLDHLAHRDGSFQDALRGPLSVSEVWAVITRDFGVIQPTPKSLVVFTVL